MEERKGRQEPTLERIIDYKRTLGGEAVKLYNKTTRKLLPWQEQRLYDYLAINDEGLWVHTKVGGSVPRRNGKTEAVTARELYGAIALEESILHTAHLVDTAHGSFENMVNLLTELGFKEKDDFKLSRQRGAERIQINGTKGEINFRTRTATGGLGRGYDLLVIDEAQEYTDDQETTLKYTVTSSHNPQTIMIGTPDTQVSRGTVFGAYRRSVIENKSRNSMWYEWGVTEQEDTENKDLWYETNPSLGYLFTERNVEDELGKNKLDFNQQRLGLWLNYNTKGVFTQRDWDKLQTDTLPPLESERYLGVKLGKDTGNVSLSIAAKTKEGKIFTEVIDCKPQRQGLAWLIPYFKNPKVKAIACDGSIGAQLDEICKENKIKGFFNVTYSEVVTASSIFEQAVFAEQVVHCGQPSLAKAVTNCEHRPIGKGGGFGYNSLITGVDISLVESVVLAIWQASVTREKKKQKIIC